MDVRAGEAVAQKRRAAILRIGGLVAGFLVLVAIVNALAHGNFLEPQQPDQRPAADRGQRDPRRRPDLRDHHRRDRSVGRFDHRPVQRRHGAGREHAEPRRPRNVRRDAAGRNRGRLHGGLDQRAAGRAARPAAVHHYAGDDAGCARAGAHLAHGQPIPLANSAPFDWIGTGYVLAGIPGFPGISWQVVVMAAVAVAFAILLGRTAFGRYVLALGGNEEAARLAGIDTRRVKTLVYVISGGCAAIGGHAADGALLVGEPGRTEPARSCSASRRSSSAAPR